MLDRLPEDRRYVVTFLRQRAAEEGHEEEGVVQVWEADEAESHRKAGDFDGPLTKDELPVGDLGNLGWVPRSNAESIAGRLSCDLWDLPSRVPPAE